MKWDPSVYPKLTHREAAVAMSLLDFDARTVRNGEIGQHGFLLPLSEDECLDLLAAFKSIAIRAVKYGRDLHASNRGADLPPESERYLDAIFVIQKLIEELYVEEEVQGEGA